MQNTNGIISLKARLYRIFNFNERWCWCSSAVVVASEHFIPLESDNPRDRFQVTTLHEEAGVKDNNYL